METKELIICAAIEVNYKGKPVTIAGKRHGHCHNTFYALTGERTKDKYNPSGHEYTSGFVTTKDRFVGRQEAYKIAFDNDQIIGPNKGYPTNEIGLTSEDLY